jgi:uncharacterized membrane protein YhaH (DUF805 family)
MDFVTAIKTCFSKYATFQGRAGRSEYWWWIFFSVLLAIVLEAISHSLHDVASLALFLPSLAVSVRRLHDGDRSGWFLLLPVPFMAIAAVLGVAGLHVASGGTVLVAAGVFGVMAFGAELVLLVWFCQKGPAGPNRYGEAPLTSLSAAPARPMVLSS